MKKAVYWLPVVLLAGTIFYFSAQSSSRQDITIYIKEYQQVINLLKEMPDIQFYYNQRLISSHQDAVGFIQFIIRKIVHLCLYGTFGLVLVQAIQNSGFLQPRKTTARAELPRPSRYVSYYCRRYFPFSWQSIVLTGFLIILTASLDEYQQAAVSGRTGCIEDVILDFCGFLLFNAFFHLWIRLRDLFY